jgi:hypothetical protein
LRGFHDLRCFRRLTSQSSATSAAERVR